MSPSGPCHLDRAGLVGSGDPAEYHAGFRQPLCRAGCHVHRSLRTGESHPPITNQWQFSQDGGNTFSNLNGATSTTLTITNLQSANTGEYRLTVGNAFGSNDTSAAILTVLPWSAAQIQWSAPVSLAGLNAGQVLTNVSGTYLEAAIFFYDSFIPVTAGNQQFVFRSDGACASISNGAYFGGQFVTNAIYGSGALGTNSTGDARFDGVLELVTTTAGCE